MDLPIDSDQNPPDRTDPPPEPVNSTTPPPRRRKRKKKRSGGPRTPEGKARSSQNARTHGLCASPDNLPDPDRAELDRLQQGWTAHFQPENFAARRLVRHLAVADALLERCYRADRDR